MNMMDISVGYKQIRGKLDSLDFGALWPGFLRCPFALYDDKRVILGEETIPKTDEFVANTAIRYKGEWIAVWKLSEDLEPDILASKIVHEMFHAHQMELHDSRFPDEMEALTQYVYSPAYLTLKYRETLLLAELSERFEAARYKEFLSLRKRRVMDFPYQYRYECGIEAIEGSAQYVEWQALKALHPSLYQKARMNCAARLSDMQRLMPVRALCYDTGATLLDVCLGNRLPVDMRIGNGAGALQPERVFQGIRAAALPAVDAVIEDLYRGSIEAFREKIQSITAFQKPVAQGGFRLLGVNVFSARYLDDYIYTEYFVMYEDGGPVTLYGNYLLQMENGFIAAIYEDLGNGRPTTVR
jgi:hypothetical protein